MALRILLVGRNNQLIESAAKFLALEPPLEVVAPPRAGPETIDAVRQVHPDLALMDLVDEMHGLQATRRIEDMRGPPALVIIDHATHHARADQQPALFL